jgi:hypothetical protein
VGVAFRRGDRLRPTGLWGSPAATRHPATEHAGLHAAVHAPLRPCAPTHPCAPTRPCASWTRLRRPDAPPPNVIPRALQAPRSLSRAKRGNLSPIPARAVSVAGPHFQRRSTWHLSLKLACLTGLHGSSRGSATQALKGSTTPPRGSSRDLLRGSLREQFTRSVARLFIRPPNHPTTRPLVLPPLSPPIKLPAPNSAD